MTDLIDDKERQRLLDLPDLTREPGAVSLMIEEIIERLDYGVPVERVEGDKIVHRAHNYDLLGYPSDDVTLAGRYTQWVDHEHCLRTQTTSLVVQELIKTPNRARVLVAPGMVYRRDVRDRWHCGQPHQMDIWVMLPKSDPRLHEGALMGLIDRVGQAAGAVCSTKPSLHHYTEGGIEMNAQWRGMDLEVGECGWICPKLLARCGWGDEWSGLAMGVGLDRLVMVRKNLPDIRLLRSKHPKAMAQMSTLDPWTEVSDQPCAKRDLSLCVPIGMSEEQIVEAVVGAMGDRSDWLEEAGVVGRWNYDEVADAGRARMGMDETMENVMVRVVLRDLHTSIPRADANLCLRDVYRRIHVGSNWVYCP